MTREADEPTDAELSEDDDLDAMPSTRDESLGAVLSAVASAPSIAPHEPAVGTMLDDTHRITARLGAGGMGVVYLARDTELQRDVAIKLHRAQHGLDRLQREAVAMAQLSHPNVLTVHGVGRWGGRLWVAMEYVPGATLRAWQAAAPRTWRETLDMVLAAGEGLAAAHHAGFVHRDFKPDNVLVGRDGRPRVGDFGLVRITGDTVSSSGVFHGTDSLDGATRRSRATAPPATVTSSGGSTVQVTPPTEPVDAVGATVDAQALAPLEPGAPTPSGLGSQLTVDGAAVGTPAYMAPEQFAGVEVDARADQFGFCVVLYEALYGRRPFPGESYAELQASVGAGVPLPPPRGKAPARLWHVLRKGLSHDRAARFADMSELLAALRAAPRHRLYLAAGALAVAAVAAFGAVYATRPTAAMIAADTCEAAGAGARATWNAEALAALDARLTALDARLAADVGPRMVAFLDRWSREFQATAAIACRKSIVDRTWSATTAGQAQRCLAERLEPLLEARRSIPTMSREDVQNMAYDIRGLAPAEECLDERVLIGGFAVPEDPEVARQVAVLEAELERVDGQSESDPAGARTALDELLPRITALGYAPLIARGLTLDGRLLSQGREFEAAADRFERAYATARAAGADAIALNAARAVIWTHGVELGRPTAARPWVVQALPEAERYGLQHSQARGVFHAAAVVAEISADYGKALELHRRMLAVDAISPIHRATLTANLAAALDASGQSAESLPIYDEALAIFTQELGEAHPRLTSTISNMVVAHVGAGDAEGALVIADRALAALDGAAGADRYDVAILAFNRAFALDALGRAADSIVAYEKLLPEMIELSGPDSTDVADVEANLSTSYIAMGRHADARPLLEHALEVRLDAYGEDHDLVASVVTNLGDVIKKAEGCAKAIPTYERALRIFATVEQRSGSPMHRKAGPQTALGQCALRAGKVTEAITLLEDAVENAEAAGNKALRYFAHFNLGDAYDKARRVEDARAQLLAARALIADTDPDGASERAEIDAWLRAHPVK